LRSRAAIVIKLATKIPATTPSQPETAQYSTIGRMNTLIIRKTFFVEIKAAGKWRSSRRYKPFSCGRPIQASKKLGLAVLWPPAEAGSNHKQTI